MTAFSDTIDTLFDSDLAVDAVYTPLPTGTPINMRAVIRHDSVVASHGGSNYRSDTTSIEIKAAAIPHPKAGDQIVADGVTYIIQGSPEAKCGRLVWALDVNHGDPE